MNLDSLDNWLSIIDIIICLVDIAIIVYLFFVKFPHEQKKKNIFRKLNRHGTKRARIRRAFL